MVLVEQLVYHNTENIPYTEFLERVVDQLQQEPRYRDLDFEIDLDHCEPIEFCDIYYFNIYQSDNNYFEYVEAFKLYK